MPDLSKRHRYLVLVICCLSLVLVSMDNNIVNVALPSLQTVFGAPISGLQWIVDSYTLVLASLLMLSGSTADRLGRKRIFLIGIVVFGLGSLLCSAAPSLEWLIVFRMMQAIGGSMLNPVAMSIITNTFTDVRERAGAIGVWGAVIGIGLAGGPIIGGLLVETAGWRSIFWINIPVCILAFILTAVFVPESKAARRRAFDPGGQLLVIALLASLVYGIIEGPARGWTSPEILTCFAVSLISLGLLLPYEKRREDPLIDVRFFRSGPFSGAIVIAVCAFGAMAGFQFLNTLYLQTVRGFSPLQAGLHLLPMAVTTVVMSPISGRVVGRYGARLPLLVAGIAFVTAGLMLTQLSATTSETWLMTAYVLFGVGFGLVNAPITNAAVSGMPISRAGVAAGIASTSRQVGQALGVAVIGSVVTSQLVGPLQTSFVEAARPGWWIITGAGAGVLVLGWFTSGKWARNSAAKVTAEFTPTTPTPIAVP